MIEQLVLVLVMEVVLRGCSSRYRAATTTTAAASGRQLCLFAALRWRWRWPLFGAPGGRQQMLRGRDGDVRYDRIVWLHAHVAAKVLVQPIGRSRSVVLLHPVANVCRLSVVRRGGRVQIVGGSTTVDVPEAEHLVRSCCRLELTLLCHLPLFVHHSLEVFEEIPRWIGTRFAETLRGGVGGR